VLVGLLDGRIVASVMVGHDGHRGAMYYVSVDPALRGQGLGRQIIAAAEGWMRERGVWKANLLVRTGNEAVLAFYEELGYVRGSSVPIEKWLDPSKRGDK
jgi:ribosomal protein S18 acetylase RimI-like enzyme